ncbi:MAG: hypothetical protein ACRD26_17955 [Vicinamibacterales bacterium]
MRTPRQARKRTIGAAGVCIVVVLCAPPVAAQQADEAFRAGLDARGDRKWQEMATHMRSAIQASPKEETRKVGRGGAFGIFGSGTEYLPHYYLGEALFNLGECAGAVEAWAVSEQQGAVRVRADAVAFIKKGYTACEAKGVLPPGRFTPLLSRTRQQVTDVTSLAGSISAAGQAHIDIWNANAGMREQYDRASGELQNAQSRLATATRTRTERDFTDAAATAERARGLFKALETQLNAAIALNTTVQGAVREIEQMIRDAEANDRAIDGRKAILSGALVAARQEASAALGRARSQLSAGRNASSVPALTDARMLAQESLKGFRGVLDELTRIERRAVDDTLAEAAAQAQEAFSFVDGGFATFARLSAEKPTAVRPELVVERDSLEKQVATLRRRLEVAQRGRDVSGIEDTARLATEVRTRLDALIGAFGPVTIIDRGVRPELVEGARLFFAGEYQQALAWLDPARLQDVPLQLHVHLFRAAALYALYVRSGEADEAQRAQALAEIEKCKQLQSAFQPDTRAFGPRFVRFYENPHATGTPAARTTSPQQEP